MFVCDYQLPARSMKDTEVFLVDDDKDFLESICHYLTKAGYAATGFNSSKLVLKELEQHQPDVLVTDFRMPEVSGMELLKAIRERYSLLPVLMISAHGDVPMAVEAMQIGAYSFLEKPFDPNRLQIIIQNAANTHRLSAANERLTQRLSELVGLDKILLGDSEIMQRLRADILDVSDTNATVLITGETGTGKEIVARALHDLSTRVDGPFVPVSCAAVSENLFEAAMFGHTAGAFTGATNASPGFFATANNGTLFLDELGACSIEHQAKLLRVIEQSEITPVGSNRARKVNVRFISATNEKLLDAVEQNRFREDLLYRLNTVELVLPPLRDRRDDIPMLYTHFLHLHAVSYEAEPPETSAEDIAVLMAHDWPGNVRELRHVAERRLLLARRGRGSAQEALNRTYEHHDVPDTLKDAMAAYEKTLIEKALTANNGHMDSVSEALGIGRRTLNEKLVKLGIDRKKSKI